MAYQSDDLTAEQLKAILVARGWTQGDFGEHVGRSPRQVHRWLTHATPIPRSVSMIARQLPVRLAEASAA